MAVFVHKDETESRIIRHFPHMKAIFVCDIIVVNNPETLEKLGEMLCLRLVHR